MRSSPLKREYSLAEVAKMLHVSVRVVRYRIKKGGLRAFSPSGNPKGAKVILLSTLQEVYPQDWIDMMAELDSVDNGGELLHVPTRRGIR